MKRPGRAFSAGCLCGLLAGTILTLAGIIGGVYFFQQRLIQAKSQQLKAPPVMAGMQADFGWQLKNTDGGVLDMASKKGETVFLHFWHPECMVCLAELPALNRLHETLGTEIALVSVIFGDEDAITQCLAGEDIRFPVYRMQGKRPALFDADQTPATFIIAPDGEIVFRHTGGAKWDDPAVLAFLRVLNTRKQEAQPADSGMRPTSS
jgi:thiol-disulfide isomerase/thioredoxin